MHRLLSYIRTTGDRAAVLWVLGVFALAIASTLAMRGPYRWLVDFEMRNFGEYFPVITFLALTVPPLPLAWIVRAVVDDLSNRMDPDRDDPDLFEGLGPGLLVAGLSVGVGLALAASVVGYVVLYSGVIEETVSIPLAARDLAAGERIGDQDIVLLANGSLPGAAVDLDGRVAATDISAGDPLYEVRLLAPGKQAGKVSLTPSGHRTQWIPVDSGVSGLGLRSGDRVDLWTTSTAARAKSATSRLSAGATVIDVKAGNPLAPARVTLAVARDDAEAVTRAVETEILSVTLRSALDLATPRPEAPTAPFAPVAASAGEVLRAAATIPAGTRLAPELFVSGFGDPQGALPAAEVEGEVVVRELLPGEKITAALLADPTRAHGLSALLARGTHGISVSPAKNKTLADYPIGGTADVLGGEHAIVGHQPAGDGCPCVVIQVSEDQVRDAVRARAMAATSPR